MQVNALRALAARAVGRRVKLTTGQTGTVTRVTAQGFTVALAGLTHAEVTFLED